jgi:hypothetical protein
VVESRCTTPPESGSCPRSTPRREDPADEPGGDGRPERRETGDGRRATGDGRPWRRAAPGAVSTGGGGDNDWRRTTGDGRRATMAASRAGGREHRRRPRQRLATNDWRRTTGDARGATGGADRVENPDEDSPGNGLWMPEAAPSQTERSRLKQQTLGSILDADRAPLRPATPVPGRALDGPHTPGARHARARRTRLRHRARRGGPPREGRDPVPGLPVVPRPRRRRRAAPIAQRPGAVQRRPHARPDGDTRARAADRSEPLDPCAPVDTPPAVAVDIAVADVAPRHQRCSLSRAPAPTWLTATNVARCRKSPVVRRCRGRRR